MRNSLIENWIDSLRAIEKHVVMCDMNLQDLVLSLDAHDCYWKRDTDTFTWAEDKEEILEDTGNVYTSDYKYFFKGDDFCLVLVESDFGDDDFMLVIDSKLELR